MQQVIRFIAVGIINTLFGYSLFALFIYCNLPYVIASFFATCIGMIFSFNTMGRLVFNNPNARLIFRFIAVSLMTYLLNISIIKICTLYFANLYLCGAIAIIIAAMVTFFCNKHFVFGRVEYEPN